MPSSLHETLIELFRQRPALAAELLANPLDVAVPEYQEARLDSDNLSELTPTEYRADAVVVLTRGSGERVLAVVVEVQLRRDKTKVWSWPVYLATLRARLRCPVILLVMCVSTTTAAWCASPIELGHPGWVLSPVVLGPDRVPVITDVAEAARYPELSVLSAMAHGAGPEQQKVMEALLTGALGSVDGEHAVLYSDVVFRALPDTARHYLEAFMSSGTLYEPKSEFVRRFVHQGRAEGRAQGEATAILAVLAARGIDVPDDIRSRITECTDLDQLDEWVRRAAVAHSIDDLFR